MKERKIDKEAYYWKKIYSIYEGEYDLKFRHNINYTFYTKEKRCKLVERERAHTHNKWMIHMVRQLIDFFEEHGEKDQQKAKL